MYLKSLEIAGFKSFAKKASLSFSSPISAIVGPNGSGKSNVAEAFRFVLGEQSIKSMRGKRGEDLIFNGGATGTAGGVRSNMASVKVVFDNTERTFNIDYDEVTIERAVHRDSSNEYKINGSPVRLKDVIELLAGAHIGASGHHIISQGEADRILSANIRERREMVEDALGLKLYQYKKEESRKKLEKTEENMKSVESLRREIAPHLKFLKKQVEKVEKVREMRDALRVMYREYFKAEEVYLSSERKAIDIARKDPAHELATLDRELAVAKDQLSKSVNRDAKSDELIAVEGKLAGARASKDSISRDIGKLEGEIGAGERTLAKQKELLARDEYKTVYLKDVEDIGRKIDGLASIGDARALFAEVKKLLTAFIFSHKTNQDSTAIAELETELARLREEKLALDVAFSGALSSEQSFNIEYNTLRDRIEREKDSNRDAEKNVFKIIARQNELRGLLAGLKTREDKWNIEDAAFRRELQEAYAIVGREALDYKNDPFIEASRELQDERRKAIEKTKIRIEDSGAGNAGDIMKEYKDVEERDAFLTRELMDLETSKASLVALIADLDARLDFEFKEGILKINTQFQNFFALMFGGGTAELTVVREKKRRKLSDISLALGLGDTDGSGDTGNSTDGSSDEEDKEGREGIDISVNLPRKRVKSLMMLSGGERALTSIALLFAISQVNPPPFIILDETDAALDEANSRKYGDMIESLSKLSQLILITHNRETMSRASTLYGVTMGSDGASRLLSIQFEEAVKVAK